MGNPATTSKLAAFGLALGLCVCNGSQATAQEYCVACSAPDAVYRCVLEKAAPTGMPLKLLCAGTLARQGGHASCAVRGGTVFDCDAPIRRIDATVAAGILAKSPGPPPVEAKLPSPVSTPRPAAPVPVPPAVPAPAVAATPPPPPTPSQASALPPAKPKPASPPQTVEQLAKDMSRSTGETLGKAGDAIGGTTRKAWDCVKSLFKSC